MGCPSVNISNGGITLLIFAGWLWLDCFLFNYGGLNAWTKCLDLDGFWCECLLYGARELVFHSCLCLMWWLLAYFVVELGCAYI